MLPKCRLWRGPPPPKKKKNTYPTTGRWQKKKGIPTSPQKKSIPTRHKKNRLRFGLWLHLGLGLWLCFCLGLGLDLGFSFGLLASFWYPRENHHPVQTSTTHPAVAYGFFWGLTWCLPLLITSSMFLLPWDFEDSGVQPSSSFIHLVGRYIPETPLWLHRRVSFCPFPQKNITNKNIHPAHSPTASLYPTFLAFTGLQTYQRFSDSPCSEWDHIFQNSGGKKKVLVCRFEVKKD